MRKILVINQGQSLNYGDIAINQVVQGFFESKEYDIDFLPLWDETKIFGFLSKNKIVLKVLMRLPHLVDYFYRRFLVKNTSKKTYDAIIIGGGDLLSNHRGFNNAIYNIMRVLDDPKYIIGVSGNRNMSRFYLRRYKKALEKATRVYVRDNATARICKNVYGVSTVTYPDVVFAFNKVIKTSYPEEERNTNLLIPMIYYKESGAYLGLKTEDEFYQFIYNQIPRKIDNLKIAITTPEDIYSAKKIQEIFSINGREVPEVVKYESLSEFMNLLNRTEVVYSCRMHGLILGAISGCVMKPIVVKGKIRAFNSEYIDSERSIDTISEEAYSSLEKLLK